MIYRVQVEIKGYVDRYVEGDNIEHAIDRAMKLLTWMMWKCPAKNVIQ